MDDLKKGLEDRMAAVSSDPKLRHYDNPNKNRVPFGKSWEVGTPTEFQPWQVTPFLEIAVPVGDKLVRKPIEALTPEEIASADAVRKTQGLDDMRTSYPLQLTDPTDPKYAELHRIAAELQEINGPKYAGIREMGAQIRESGDLKTLRSDVLKGKGGEVS